MSDYFAFAAARTRPVAPLRAVRPLPGVSVLDEIADPFAAVAPLDRLDIEPALPAQPPPVAAPRPSSSDVAPPDVRSSDSLDSTAGTELTELRPPGPTPVAAPIDRADVVGPVSAEPAVTAPTPPSPLDAVQPAVERAQVDPPAPLPFLPAIPPPASQPEPVFDVDHDGSDRTADLLPGRDAPRSEMEPRPVPPPTPATADEVLDALAMADAFMRDVIEPRLDDVEPHAFDDIVASATQPQVVIDRVTVEVVAPARPVNPPPARGRVPRAAARLESGRRADTRWGS